MDGKEALDAHLPRGARKVRSGTGCRTGEECMEERLDLAHFRLKPQPDIWQKLELLRQPDSVN